MSRLVLYIVGFLLLSSVLPAQKKKEIKKYRIAAVTVTEMKGSKVITDQKTEYNSDGEILKETNYDKEGRLKSITLYKYDKMGNLSEETQYDATNAVFESRRYKYNILGEKTEELTMDKNGRQVKREEYLYNKQGLRIQKKTFNKDNVLTSTKTITYTTR